MQCILPDIIILLLHIHLLSSFDPPPTTQLYCRGFIFYVVPQVALHYLSSRQTKTKQLSLYRSKFLNR